VAEAAVAVQAGFLTQPQFLAVIQEIFINGGVAVAVAAVVRDQLAVRLVFVEPLLHHLVFPAATVLLQRRVRVGLG
jgi:hypothetical protein